MQYTHQEIMHESKAAPESLDQKGDTSAALTAVSEESFELRDHCQKSDLSTDSGSEVAADEFAHTSRRLPIFLTLEEEDSPGAALTDRKGGEDEPLMTEASQSLLKLIGLEEECSENAPGVYSENWSQSAGDHALFE